MPTSSVRPLGEGVRDRLTPRTVASSAVALAVLWFLVDSPAHLATSIAGMALLGALDVVGDVYDLRASVERGALGAYATLGGLALFSLPDGDTWLPVAFVVAGGWFVLDAVQTLRHEGATEDRPDGRDVYLDYVARRVHDLVGERARTRRELDDALAADTAAVDAALARLCDRGVVERAGSEYRVASVGDPGRLARAREWSVRALRRLARPVTVEFGHRETDDGWSDRVRSRVGGDDAATGPDDGVTSGTGDSGAGGGSGRSENPERERA